MDEQRPLRTYSFETKVNVVKAITEEHISHQEAMTRFGIVSRKSVQTWLRVYRQGGLDALREKPVGRPLGAKNKVKEGQEQADRILFLEAQVAYLKKVAALKAARTGKKPVL